MDTYHCISLRCTVTSTYSHATGCKKQYLWVWFAFSWWQWCWTSFQMVSTICVSFLETCLFRHLNWTVCLFHWVVRVVYMFCMQVPDQICKYFPYFVSFNFLDKHPLEQKRFFKNFTEIQLIWFFYCCLYILLVIVTGSIQRIC